MAGILDQLSPTDIANLIELQRQLHQSMFNAYYGLPPGWNWQGQTPQSPLPENAPQRANPENASAPQRNPKRQTIEKAIKDAAPDSENIDLATKLGLPSPTYTPFEFSPVGGYRRKGT